MPYKESWESKVLLELAALKGDNERLRGQLSASRAEVERLKERIEQETARADTATLAFQMSQQMNTPTTIAIESQIGQARTEAVIKTMEHAKQLAQNSVGTLYKRIAELEQRIAQAEADAWRREREAWDAALDYGLSHTERQQTRADCDGMRDHRYPTPKESPHA